MAEIAFDFDGTLVDCRRRQVALLRAIDPCIGAKEANAIWLLKRNGHSTRKAMVAIGIDEHRAYLISRQWEFLVETPFWLAFDAVQTGVRGELERLSDAGAKIALVTARKNGYWLRQQLRQLELTHLVDEVCVVDPHAACEQKSIHLKRLKPNIFVGDSEADAEAAETAGIRFVAVGWGQRSPDFLGKCGMSDCFDTLSDALSRRWWV